ncbi:S26 family signal peptidase [Candidatus Binatus sp.]|uniref:S26 family signal peptidase n=1 Tax=Candidatus Binatus sp. TaxID=2811406 RepID=UPI003C596594
MKYHSENILPIGGVGDISPSWNQFRAPLLAGISTVLLAAGITFLMRHFRIGLTPSNSSCAEGFYRLIEAPIRRGDLVAACISTNAAHDGLTRGYLSKGDCSGGAEPVLKVIGGLHGDEVDVEEGWVAVNGKRLANSATVTRDSVGRLLTHVMWGKRRVASEEVWLFGLNNRRSWDSRYFGPIPLRAIRGVAEPLLTW